MEANKLKKITNLLPHTYVEISIQNLHICDLPAKIV